MLCRPDKALICIENLILFPRRLPCFSHKKLFVKNVMALGEDEIRFFINAS